MSEQLYVFQALLIGSVLLVLFRHQPRLIQIQVIVWTLGVTGIALRYGLFEQLNFYSNDQRYYQDVVDRLVVEQTFLSEAFSIESAKVPFTGPALILAFAGIHPALALKTVSLICLLVLSSDVLKRYGERTIAKQSQTLFLTGCGGIGIFFSMLALRETMMMLFVYRYVTGSSAVSRVISLSVVYLLRPHLAVALGVGEGVVMLWRWLRRRDSINHLEVVLFVSVSTVVGTGLYELQTRMLQGGGEFQDGFLGIAYVTRVASNFVGLQFLTVPEGTVNFSLLSLLVLRVVLSETILIPLGFSVACLLFAHNLKTHHLLALSAFATYVSVATNTDFNSFRQNIPFMPLLGFVILDMIRLRRAESRTIQSQRPVGGRSIRGGSNGSEGEIKPIRTR